MAEPVTGEVRQAEVGNDLIPIGRVSDGGGGEHARAPETVVELRIYSANLVTISERA